MSDWELQQEAKKRVNSYAPISGLNQWGYAIMTAIGANALIVIHNTLLTYDQINSIMAMIFAMAIAAIFGFVLGREKIQIHHHAVQNEYDKLKRQQQEQGTEEPTEDH